MRSPNISDWKQQVKITKMIKTMTEHDIFYPDVGRKEDLAGVLHIVEQSPSGSFAGTDIKLLLRQLTTGDEHHHGQRRWQQVMSGKRRVSALLRGSGLGVLLGMFWVEHSGSLVRCML